MPKNSKGKAIVMDFDDLCDNTVNKLEYLCKLKDLMPGLKCTLFTIPGRTSASTISAVKSLGDYVQLGMHGWIHVLGECFAWTSEEALMKMQMAEEMGIDGKVFRAPKWVLDAEIYHAAKELGYVVADHKDYRVLGSGARTYTYNMPLRDPPYLRVHGHLPNVSGNGIEEHFEDFVFDKDSQFKHITEVV